MVLGGYVRWVGENPRLATDLEKAVRGITLLTNFYLRQKRHSLAVMEILTNLNKLISWVNDRFLERAVSFAHYVSYTRVEYYLGFLETSEAVLEMAAAVAAGEVGRWTVVAAVQTLKTVLRLLLLFRQRRMISYPMVEPVPRSDVLKSHEDKEASSSSSSTTASAPVLKGEGDDTIELKRSGKRMRTVDAAPSAGVQRSWRLPSFESSADARPLTAKARARLGYPRMTDARLAGEVAYACSPAAHLAAMAAFGSQSWKPFMLSLACDLFSFGVHHSRSAGGGVARLDLLERRELRRRRAQFLLYLLRSPLYDTKTKAAILQALHFCKDKVPIAGKVAAMLISYLPQYRQIYSYMWSK